MAVLTPLNGGYYLWQYLPSIPAAVIFVLLFFVMTALISWRMYKSKTWFCIPFVIGGAFEVIGYCARIWSHNETGKIMPYATQNLFILLGPALFAASIYMCLSRIIQSVRGDMYSLIRPSWLTKVFVIGDVLSFMVQSGAAGLMVTDGLAKAGEDMVIGGLLIQVFFFAFFAVTAGVFQMRIGRRPTPESRSPQLPWKKSMRMLYIVSAFIMVRSVFRVIEYAMGHDGYLLKHEWTLYIFDSTLMFAVMVIYYMWYPTWIATEKVEPQGFSV